MILYNKVKMFILILLDWILILKIKMIKRNINMIFGKKGYVFLENDKNWILYIYFCSIYLVFYLMEKL